MVRRVLALALAFGVLAAGCSSDDPPETGADGAIVGEDDGSQLTGNQDSAPSDDAAVAAAAPGEPIKLGDVSSYSGLNIFPESAEMARLVFKRYNEQGGVDGRPIQLVSVDDQDSLEGAASGARRLLLEEKVVGFCCGGSISDCFANAEYYAENEIQVVAGAAACQSEAPTVHPINVGPFVPTWHMLDFFHHDLGHENVCFTGYDVPLTGFFQGVIMPAWEENSGITVNQYIIPPGDDLTPWVTKIVDDGCQAVEAAFTELNAQSFFRVVQDQGALDGIDWGMLTSGYSLSLLDSAGDTLEGVYANSEYEPFTGGDYTPMVEDYLALAEEVGVLPTSFGEGGYLAAHIMIAVLESIEGEINRESVQQAILEIEYENTIMGGTWRATGISPTLQPNLNSKILQVQGDDFIPKTDWRVFPLPAEG